MCKYCDTIKEKSLLSYDNYGSMNVCYGQYQGVNVVASLSMKGNMLMLNASGSYRSTSDCYYEEEGLDCDNKQSIDSPGNYIKIKYCPFCGKELNSTIFDKKKLTDDIELVKRKLEKAKNKLALAGLRVTFTFTAKDDLYDKAKDIVWKDYHANCKLLPVRLETIIKEFGTLKAHMIYGRSGDDGYYYNSPCPAFNPEEGVKFNGSAFNEFHGYTYSITEEQYDTLINMGLAKRNINKLKDVKVKHAKYQEDVDKLNKKLNALKMELKKL